MYNRQTILTLILVSSFIGVVACASKADSKEQTVKSELTQNYSESSTLRPVGLDSCSSVLLIKGDEKIVLSPSTSKGVLSYLSSAVYDKERNESGIKYKMTEPDYTFLLELKGENKIAQLWLPQALLLFDGRWYLPISAMSIDNELEKYSNKQSSNNV